jgi:arylsulfatase A-like enzyme
MSCDTIKSVFTGESVSELFQGDNQHFSLKPGVTTIAERFKESGYRTGAVISGAPLRRTYGLDRGFDHYDDQGLGIQGDNAITPSSRPAEVTTARALEWLGKQPRDARLFLWVHYYDPHEPYLPPSPYFDRYPGRPYAGEVAYVDAQREYAYGPATGLPASKVGSFTQPLYDEAKTKGWTVISIRNDWKRVFAFE